MKYLLQYVIVLGLFCNNINLQAQISNPSTYDLRLTNTIISENFCFDLQIRASDSAPDFAIGSYTIWLDYNSFSITSPIYTPINLFPETECEVALSLIHI